MYRTHTCGELNLEHLNKTVSLAGWIQRSRDLGGMTFVDLRDRYGITQLVFNMEENRDLCLEARKLGREFVIQVTGKVADPVVEQGFIARQTPLAGVRVDKGTRLAVVVSEGSNRLQVPSLQNVRLADALQQLKKAGLKWGETRFARHNTVAPGNVISTDPAAGSMVAPGTMINLKVSRKAPPPGAAAPKVAPAPATEETALALAAQIAPHPPESVARIKSLLHEWDGVVERSAREGRGQVEALAAQPVQ